MYSLVAFTMACCVILIADDREKLDTPDAIAPTTTSGSTLSSDTSAENLDVEGSANGSVKFATEIYNVLLENTDKKNVVFSPLGFRRALAVLAMGAKGKTLDSAISALGYSKKDFSDLKLGEFTAWSTLLSNRESGNPQENPSIQKPPQLLCDTNVWIQTALKYNEAFVSKANSLGSVNLLSVDFSNSQSVVQEISAKSGFTQGQETFEETLQLALRENTNCVITNTVMFKGEWPHLFDPEDTSDASFYIAPNVMKRVPFMKARVLSAKMDNDVHVILFPYAGSEDCYFIVVYPPRNTFQDFFSVNLASEQIEKWLDVKEDALSISDVFVPKYSIEFSEEMSLFCSRIGFPIQDADYSGIIQHTNLSLSDFVHQTKFKIEEFGTTAQAFSIITSVTIGMKRIPEIRIDSPFLFFVYDRKNNQVLFMGRCMVPDSDPVSVQNDYLPVY